MLGVHPALVQFGARAHAQGRRAEVADLLAKTQGFRILVAAPVLTVVVVTVVSDIDPWLKVAAVVFGVVVPAALDGAPACLAIENKSAANAKVVLLGSLITQAAVLAVVLTIATADVVWVVRLVAVSTVVLFALVPVSGDYRRAVLRPRWPRSMPSGFWRFAVSTGVAAMIGTLVSSRSEVVVLNWLSDPVAVGTFALAFGLATHIYAPAQAMLGPLVPAIAGLREVSEDSVAEALSKVLRGSATFVSLLSAIVLPAFAALVPTLYGSSFAGVAPLMMVLGFAGGFGVIGGGIGAFVLARLSATKILQANVAGLVVDVVLAVVLIPSLGAWGAVIANVAAGGTGVVIMLDAERRSLRAPWRSVFADLAPAFVGIAVGCASWLISRTVGPPVLASLAAALVGAGGVISLLKAFKTGLRPGDAGAVTRTLPSVVQPLARRTLSAITNRR